MAVELGRLLFFGEVRPLLPPSFTLSVEVNLPWSSYQPRITR